MLDFDNDIVNLLKCPKCHEDLFLHLKNTDKLLSCKNAHAYYIRNSIPRFVDSKNYATSFGYEWNRFPKTQIDEFSKVKQSEQRIRTELSWQPSDVKGKLVLGAGCGSGRFAEVLVRWGARVVAMDLS